MTNPENFEQLKQTAPKRWQTSNIAMIIETDFINGGDGPPNLLATEVW